MVVITYLKKTGLLQYLIYIIIVLSGALLPHSILIKILNFQLTQTAINDYNRGRMYLADLAIREQVSVFESITEAVELAIQKSL